jgi:two-component system response regulator CiaR
MRVLVVEDDRDLRRAVVTMLAEEMYAVDEAEAGDVGLFLAESGSYDLVVLDVMLPLMDGFAVTRELRRRGVSTPILLLTAKDAVEDRVRGLDAGADDYLTKPFAMEELLARARALLRRQGRVTPDGEMRYGRLSLRAQAFDGFVDDQPLKLTQKEYKLLEYLLRNREQIVTREQIFDRVWGFDVEANLSVVDVYLHYVRKKLAAHGCDRLIRTIRGVGYMLKETT